jgi:hypothetical protein
MRVPRALERENAGHRGLSVQEPSNGVRLGFDMLRLTARCCGENFSGARAIGVRRYSSALLVACRQRAFDECFERSRATQSITRSQPPDPALEEAPVVATG